MLCGPEGVPVELDGLEELEPLELEAMPAVHSARLIIPSLFLSRDSKLGLLLRLAKPESVEPDAEPDEPTEPDEDEPIDPDESVLPEEPDTLGVLGEVALGEVVLGEVVLLDVWANAPPTARVIAETAINACFSFMSNSSEV